ncbi:hypothetical protein FB567DRAFT_531333 [Paraphoma chrysanthemicola]|uniref:F-box domain-containing protein n=1 Tax=Paraphoma chrysanthemicola TaxID=798071 RepID=A0A8K0R1B4_9PLEO|nr:hypothetical protein FB567DRAFT_531333 [Paraphoma chrysanthemicola]
MADLPSEIYLAIFSYLPKGHLVVVVQACRTFAALAKPLLFETLVLHGDRQYTTLYEESDEENDEIEVLYPGRTKTVELGELVTTVDELIASDIARHVKRLKFGPRFYSEGFTPRYRHWITFEMERWEEWEYDQEPGSLEKRRARSEGERMAIEEAERTWHIKIAKQKSKAQENLAALACLLRHMPKLDSIEILPWFLDREGYLTEKPHIMYSCYEEVATQFSIWKTTLTHLTMFSEALLISKNCIKYLRLPLIDPPSLTFDHSLESLFGHLIRLSFDIENPSFMTRNFSQRAPAFLNLIQFASKTLQEIEFGRDPVNTPMPPMQALFLEKLFQRVSCDTKAPELPLVFPMLKSLKLRNMFVDASSLIAFLSQQPHLEFAYFESIDLMNTELKWEDVAAALPASCQKFHVNACGHHSDNPHGRSTYMVSFKASDQILPEVPGWRISEKLLEEEWVRLRRHEIQVIDDSMEPSSESVRAEVLFVRI